MNTNWKSRWSMILAALVFVVGLALLARNQPVRAERAPDTGSSPHYTVIDTEGHNLIVTDNQTNTLYFYTIDKDREIGSELKLRGSLDLNQVGKPALKIMKSKAE